MQVFKSQQQRLTCRQMKKALQQRLKEAALALLWLQRR
jgi:hypothetical protein